MKRILAWFFGGVLVLLIGLAFFVLYKKSKAVDVVFETESPEVTDLVKKTVATGSIVPREEVEVKPKVSGVLAKLFVTPDTVVKEGDPLGEIQIIPDAMQVNQAEAGVRTAQIAYENAQRELKRNEDLAAKDVVADAELQRFRTEHALRRQELATAQSTLQLVREGATRGAGKTSMLVVTATVPGTVIDVPVKKGFSVIQANNFNAGTTIAVIANMGDIIFEGRVDESEVAKIKTKMKLQIKVGALENKLDGELEYIAPKGKLVDGAIQFEIKAKVIAVPKDTVIRANYSANADIVLDERKQVLAIREALVQYKGDKPFVEVETAPQVFVAKDVKLGLSDGIKVEVLEGVAKTDKIKIPEHAGPANPEMGSGSGKGPPPKKK